MPKERFSGWNPVANLFVRFGDVDYVDISIDLGAKFKFVDEDGVGYTSLHWQPTTGEQLDDLIKTLKRARRKKFGHKLTSR